MDPNMEKTFNSLKKNNFNVEYVEKSEDVADIVLKLIPEDAALEMAGGMSVDQVGVKKLLIERGNKGLVPDEEGFNPYVVNKTRKDVLLVSTNAVTLDGKLVNIDGMGNRVTGMVYGPTKTILVVGRNKIVKDVDEALDRVQNVIAPYHAKNMGVPTPCSKTGKCEDCNSPARICNITTIISKKPPGMDFTIILVNEDLGLGYDPDWPQERIEKITSAYREEWQRLMDLMGGPPSRED
ncbi:lactate utilization protein [Thermodesulfobacteriota bacterium]